MLKKGCGLIVMTVISFFLPFFVSAQSIEDQQYEKRLDLYKQIETVTNIPWYYVAAADQYERNIRALRNDLPKAKTLSGIYIQKEKWIGLLNPNPNDVNPRSIRFFDGLGRDGNGDGRADPFDDVDILYSFAHYLLQFGTSHDQIKIGLWNYYKRDKTVKIILEIAKLYKQFQRIDLDEHHFPLPIHSNYTYHDTWGDRRGWGGRRIHEGTDIFASYGVNVYSTCYGVVELKGWNKYGGWRIGIRDMNNTYHYFAHLNGFAKDLKIGDIVKPGQLIGSVGSSGYGPPGTAGKFPPHLHFGMYKDNGKTEWSFDPYPHLKRWEREAKKRK